MRSSIDKRFAAGLGAVALFGAPAVALAATTDAAIVPNTVTAALTGQQDVAEQMRRHAHRELVDGTVRLARRHAKLDGEQLRKGYRKAVTGWSNERLQRKQRSLRRQIRDLRSIGGAPDVAIPAHLRAIAQCESGGDPRAIGGGGMYRGAYQFSFATWAAVGGKGDPAAASMEEQTRRAAILYARSGAGQWPVCGR
jgi:hypothetical protein